MKIRCQNTFALYVGSYTYSISGVEFEEFENTRGSDF